MNIYGDRGNIICLQKRAEWRGKQLIVEEYNIGQTNFVFDDIDIFFFGGGQDMQQIEVADDLVKIGDKLKKQLLTKNAALLSICGGMQLLGNYYQTKEGKKINGIGLFDAYTVGGNERFIGNVVVESDLVGAKKNLVGFENHSGRTYAKWGDQKPLGKVVIGSGNNGEDKTEGIIFKNMIGSYLHGSLLPKNPWLADWLLLRAFIRRYGAYQLEMIDDEIEEKAGNSVIKLAQRVGRVKNITS